VYWGADTAVASADATTLISKLCMHIFISFTSEKHIYLLFSPHSLASSILPAKISTTDIAVWDQKNFDDKGLERKGSYWILSIVSN